MGSIKSAEQKIKLSSFYFKEPSLTSSSTVRPRSRRPLSAVWAPLPRRRLSGRIQRPPQGEDKGSAQEHRSGNHFVPLASFGRPRRRRRPLSFPGGRRAFRAEPAKIIL